MQCCFRDRCARSGGKLLQSGCELIQKALCRDAADEPVAEIRAKQSIDHSVCLRVIAGLDRKRELLYLLLGQHIIVFCLRRQPEARCTAAGQKVRALKRKPRFLKAHRPSREPRFRLADAADQA